MKLKNALNDDEVLELARLPETGPGAALLKFMEFELVRAQRDYDENPMLSNDKKDFRFKAGLIAGIKLAKQASSNARQMVEIAETKRSES